MQKIMSIFIWPGNFFHTVLDDQEETNELTQEERKLFSQIARKRGALKAFEKTYFKYKNLIIKTKERLHELRIKLKEYHVAKEFKCSL